MAIKRPRKPSRPVPPRQPQPPRQRIFTSVLPFFMAGCSVGAVSVTISNSQPHKWLPPLAWALIISGLVLIGVEMLEFAYEQRFNFKRPWFAMGGSGCLVEFTTLVALWQQPAATRFMLQLSGAVLLVCAGVLGLWRCYVSLRVFRHRESDPWKGVNSGYDESGWALGLLTGMLIAIGTVALIFTLELQRTSPATSPQPVAHTSSSASSWLLGLVIAVAFVIVALLTSRKKNRKKK